MTKSTLRRSLCLTMAAGAVLLSSCAGPKVKINRLAAGRFEAVSEHFNPTDAQKEGLKAAAKHCADLKKPFNHIRSQGRLLRKRQNRYKRGLARPKMDPRYQMPEPTRDYEVTVKFACKKRRKERSTKGRKSKLPPLSVSSDL